MLSEVQRFMQKVRVDPSGCWIWVGPLGSKGYGNASFRRGGHGAHRVALVLFKEAKLGGPWFACHTCDVRACVNPAHLYEGDVRTNSQDARDRNRLAKGERNGAAKLTAAQVEGIRAGAWDGVSTRRLGAAFGMSHETVRDIVNNVLWPNPQYVVPPRPKRGCGRQPAKRDVCVTVDVAT